MGNLKELKAQLAACKNTGRWRQIAAHAECDYQTVVRIARGEIKDPGISVAERIFCAIEATARPTSTA